VKLNWPDALIALWALLAGGAFVVGFWWGIEWLEPELVGRCVYLVVLTAGALCLALRALAGLGGS